GNIVDTLMPPLSPLEMVIGYLSGGIGRGVFVALAIGFGLLLFLGIGVQHPIMALVFVVLGSAFLGGLGIIAGVYANKFDQMAAITNFIVTPLAFLSGTFYSVSVLPPVLRQLTQINPIFYLIDGLRYSVIGVSDSDPWSGMLICFIAVLVVTAISWQMFRTGYRLKP
ncbi:MAG: ABC transporter permease, partial [Planktotalea sp.]|uniref:ABC transporter permease n=1 Tax=Planktotalea sp. TaxID=2029877 RepID=UPI003C70E66F